MPAQPLTPAQLADAARLKALFQEWKEDRRARGEPHSQETVAALLGFNTQSSVSQYLNGRIPLNVNALVKFAALLGKQPEDISIDLAKEIQRIAESVPSDTEGEEFIPIRRLDVRLSAGRGQLFTSEEEKSRLSFRADFLQSIGAAPHNTVAVSVSGDSMEPIIPDGSTLLVDRGNRHVVNGKVYALRQNGCLLVKRLYITTSGYVARSDNAAENYPDIPLDEEHPDFEIIGRAVWVGFKL